MRAVLSALALALALAPAARAATVEEESAALLERAALWQSRYRDDLARDALDRLFRLDANHPEGLLLLARIQLRAGQEAEAERTYERLRKAHPNHAAAKQLAALLRIRGPDREKYRQAQQLARAGHAEEAAKAYRALFPDGPPDDELALEYALVLAATDGGWDAARAQLAQLAARHPDDPRYRLAYASHLSTRKPVAAETFRALRELAAEPAVAKPAREAWRRAVLRLDAVEESLPPLREYVAGNPDDATARERLAAVAQAVERQRRLETDPGYRARREGLAHLEAGRLDEARDRLQVAVTAHPDDAEAAGALGIVLMRQGRHGQAHEFLREAARLDASGRAKWEELARTARFWDLVGQAGAARQAGRPELAERHYREALALDPANATALEGLAAVLLQAGRDAEVVAMLDRLPAGSRSEVARAVDGVRAGRLRDEAKRLQEQGRAAEAVAALERAASLDPADPWLRLDLARLYAAGGEPARGEALFDALLARRPRDADARFATALYLSGVDRESQALAVLEPVAEAGRTAGMTSLQRRLWVSVQGRRAEALARQGRSAESARLLAAAERAVGDDAELALEIASAHVQIGDFAAARALLDRLSAPPAQPPLDWRIGQARLLNRMQADAELGALLENLAPAGPKTPAQERELADLKRWLAWRQAAALRQAGRSAEAADAYRAILGERPGDTDAAIALAEVLVERGEHEAARPLVDAALAASPEDPGALAVAARLALADGAPEQAIALEQRSRAARLARRAPDGGLSTLSRPSVPGGPFVVEAAPAAALAKEQGYPGEHRRLAELLDRRSPLFSSALDWRYRAGTSGKSQVSAQELPLEWRENAVGDFQWFVRAEPARVNAGALDLADTAEAATFGSVLLCQPPCATGSVAQLETGVAFGAGLERPGLRVDAGSSPAGFPVVNFLGGLLYRGDLGPASYSIDVSRRPVTSSLLSWSGTQDPRTGRTWGGVVATGVRLGVARDSGGEYGAWGSLGLHRLDGRDVLANDRAQLMAGGYRRFVNEEDRQLTLGLTGMWWRHAENAGEFTFGHGGYYSPRTYRSLAIPVAYAFRTPLTSFAVRASVSVAWSEFDRAPFFPTDPALQAQAEALAPFTGVDPFHAGGDQGRSYGRALGAAVEHQLLPGLFVGARAELERSTNYTPNRFLLYLRFLADRPSARPVALPPEPVLPGSQY